ncbi:hypothetical protein ACFQ7B_41535 [Streptomyces erythrochromogenes]|uniref:hypothetical protein n=1 Tax=Streptomyces erythrochromogenes TaxID=285574 RepID=UPI0036758CAC
MTRIGQVSGLAAVQLRLMVLLTVVILVVICLHRRWPALAVSVGAAMVAGLAGGVTASGSVVALGGTDWPIYGDGGDIGNLMRWASGIVEGIDLPPEYPPGFPHLLAMASDVLFGGDIPRATKWVMIGFLAVSGPAAYLAWRLLLPPLWALGIGVTSALPLVDLYKPYSPLVLVVVIPVFAKLVQATQRSAAQSRRRTLVTSAVLGAVLAAMFLLYSGWFVWSAVGLIILFAFILVGLVKSNGLQALREGIWALATACTAFLVLAGPYLVRLLKSSRSAKDTYFYFDTLTDPAYFAMWGGDRPGPQRAIWPPLGELGGVGMFSIILVIGMAVALALALRQPAVLTLAACTASAFLLRYWYASHMQQDHAVQLYPRTSQQITYCLLALTGLAVYYSVDRIRNQAHNLQIRQVARVSRPGRGHVVSVLCALTLLFGMAGSATANAFMATGPDDGSPGELTWRSHTLQQPDGQCPKYAPEGKCMPYTPPTPASPNH